MNERPAHTDRELLIAGDLIDCLHADELEDLSLLAELLADPATWAQPRAELEDAVVGSVVNAPDGPRVSTSRPPTVRRRSHRFAWSAGAAAAAAALVVAAVSVSENARDPEFSARLAGGPLAPAADAKVDITRNDAGFRIDLYAHGLPDLATGEYYQAWLKNDAGTLVPVGTFSSGDEDVTLWSGVSPRDFPMLTVTIETVDGEATSSGMRALQGSIRNS